MGRIKAQLPGFGAWIIAPTIKRGIKSETISKQVNATNKLTPRDDLPIHTQINTKAKLIQYYGKFMPKAIT